MSDVFVPSPRLAYGAPVSGRQDDRLQFEAIIDAMHGDLTAAGAFIANDAGVRRQYQQQVSKAAADLRRAALEGRISWAKAAQEASELRNLTLETMRARSSPVGRALAESMKKEGLTLETLLQKYARKRFGEKAVFAALSAEQKNAVYGEVVAAAGRSNPKVNARMLNAARAGRGLVILSVAISVYAIATADDKVEAAKKEGTIAAAGIGGAMLGGAVAGLVCGPGAPVCSTVGALVGGALAAFGVSALW